MKVIAHNRRRFTRGSLASPAIRGREWPGVPFPPGQSSDYSQSTMSAHGHLHQDSGDFLISLWREILAGFFSDAHGKVIEVDHQLHQARPEILLDRHTTP